MVQRSVQINGRRKVCMRIRGAPVVRGFNNSGRIIFYKIGKMLRDLTVCKYCRFFSFDVLRRGRFWGCFCFFGVVSLWMSLGFNFLIFPFLL